LFRLCRRGAGPEAERFIPFLPQLADSAAQQISIEAAQPKLDLGILSELAGKTILLGVIDLADQAIETPEQVAQRIRAALQHVATECLIPAPDCGMKYLARETAFGKLKGPERGRGDRSPGALVIRIGTSARLSRTAVQSIALRGSRE